LKAKGYDLIYLAQFSWSKDYSFVRHCQSRNVEGVVVFGFQRDDMDFAELVEAGLPTVFIDLDIREGRAGYITSDNREAAAGVVDYLFGLGHRRIAYLSGNKDSYANVHRFEGYRSGMAARGLPYREEHVAPGDYTRETGYRGMQHLLALPEPPTAVVCCSDMSAMGAIDAIQDAGLSVPGDVSVVGFDDIEMAAYVRPALTTVRQDMASIGRRAVELLDELIGDDQLAGPEAILPTELVVRESTGPVKPD